MFIHVRVGAQLECVIRPNESIRLSLEAGLEHSCSVVVDDAWKPSDPLGSTSAVVFQLHAQRANVSLRFDGCKEVVGCGPAPAPHVGLLKPLSANNSVHAFNFNLSCVCLHGGACNGSGGVTSGGNGNDDGCCCGSGEKINVLAAAVPLLSYGKLRHTQSKQLLFSNLQEVKNCTVKKKKTRKKTSTLMSLKPQSNVIVLVRS